MSTYGTSLPQEKWNKHLDVIRALLEAWWENPKERISPTPLLDGSDLLNELNLEPGPKIGQLLEAVREAQAVGNVQTRVAALTFVRRKLEE